MATNEDLGRFHALLQQLEQIELPSVSVKSVIKRLSSCEYSSLSAFVAEGTLAYTKYSFHKEQKEDGLADPWAKRLLTWSERAENALAVLSSLAEIKASARAGDPDNPSRKSPFATWFVRNLLRIKKLEPTNGYVPEDEFVALFSEAYVFMVGDGAHCPLGVISAERLNELNP